MSIFAASKLYPTPISVISDRLTSTNPCDSIPPMRLLIAAVLLMPVFGLAQDDPKAAPKKAAMPEPKNLKILKGQTGEQVLETMRSFRIALGVQCTYCHVQPAGGPPVAHGNKYTERRGLCGRSAWSRGPVPQSVL